MKLDLSQQLRVSCALLPRQCAPVPRQRRVNARQCRVTARQCRVNTAPTARQMRAQVRSIPCIIHTGDM
jgi:hypothetical protein